MVSKIPVILWSIIVNLLAKSETQQPLQTEFCSVSLTSWEKKGVWVEKTHLQDVSRAHGAYSPPSEHPWDGDTQASACPQGGGWNQP